VQKQIDVIKKKGTLFLKENIPVTALPPTKVYQQPKEIV
jgi:hypothetical protein